MFDKKCSQAFERASWIYFLLVLFDVTEFLKKASLTDMFY
jgi:hypothetical protein